MKGRVAAPGEMKSAFERLREDVAYCCCPPIRLLTRPGTNAQVGYVRTWGSNTDGQLGHFSGKPSLVEIRGVMRQLSCGGARPPPPSPMTASCMCGAAATKGRHARLR